MAAPPKERIVDDWAGGFGWIADPEEAMERTSHAIDGSEGLWLIDPVDMPGLDALLEDRGDVAGVVVTLGRHTRDAATVARRHDVRVHFPEPLLSLAEDVEADTGTIQPLVRDTGVEVLPVIDVPGWREFALYAADAGTVRVPEAVGTAPHFLAPGERLGVHPVLRLTPPRSSLGDVTAERVLVGHGRGVMHDGTTALAHALAHARRGAPRVYLRGCARFPRVFFEWVRSST